MVSGVIYLLTLHFGWQPHSYPDDEAWYFNPLAWQFLFVIGATAGYAPYSRQVLTMPSAWLAKLAIGITVAVAIIHRAGSQPDVMAITKWSICECRKCWWG